MRTAGSVSTSPTTRAPRLSLLCFSSPSGTFNLDTRRQPGPCLPTGPWRLSAHLWNPGLIFTLGGGNGSVVPGANWPCFSLSKIVGKPHFTSQETGESMLALFAPFSVLQILLMLPREPRWAMASSLTFCLDPPTQHSCHLPS